jgi:hypothetical protein
MSFQEYCDWTTGTNGCAVSDASTVRSNRSVALHRTTSVAHHWTTPVALHATITFADSNTIHCATSISGSGTDGPQDPVTGTTPVPATVRSTNTDKDARSET